MNYNPQVEFLWGTPNPEVMVAKAATQTMHKEMQSLKNADALCEKLYKMKHYSPFEHVSASIRLTGVSRAFMAQITRHRHLSFTCSSQHYQDYSDYEWYTSQQVEKSSDKFINSCILHYAQMVDSGVPVHEARQVLPNAMAVNMVITGNARAWAEMLQKRLCKRNTYESFWACDAIHKVLKNWFLVFKHVGPSCEEIGICFEGNMSCGRAREVR